MLDVEVFWLIWGCFCSVSISGFNLLQADVSPGDGWQDLCLDVAFWVGSNVGQLLLWSDQTEQRDLRMEIKDRGRHTHTYTHTHTHTHTLWPSGVEWSLDKLIRIGDVYGFSRDSLELWPIFNCLDATVRTTRQPGCWHSAGCSKRCRVAASDRTSGVSLVARGGS